MDGGGLLPAAAACAAPGKALCYARRLPGASTLAAQAAARPSRQPPTPRSCRPASSCGTPRASRRPAWSCRGGTPRSSGVGSTGHGRASCGWTPRTPTQALAAWQARDEAERQEVADGLEALYRHRKATLRYLRRCEDADDLDALQRLLDPQPHRIDGSVVVGGARQCATPRSEVEAAKYALAIPASFGGCAAGPQMSLATGSSASTCVSSPFASTWSDGEPMSHSARLAMAGLADAPRLHEAAFNGQATLSMAATVAVAQASLGGGSSPLPRAVSWRR